MYYGQSIYILEEVVISFEILMLKLKLLTTKI